MGSAQSVELDTTRHSTIKWGSETRTVYEHMRTVSVPCQTVERSPKGLASKYRPMYGEQFASESRCEPYMRQGATDVNEVYELSGCRPAAPHHV
jgi:hypothetical protein